MRTVFSTLATVVTAYIATIAVTVPLAAQLDPDQKNCNSNDPDTRLLACTRVLNRGNKETISNRSIAFNNRGWAYNVKSQFDNALRDLDQAIRLNPRNKLAHYNRGVALQGQGDYDRAIHEYEEAMRLDPGFTIAYTGKGNVHLLKGDVERAKANFYAALGLPAKDDLGIWAHNFARAKLAELTRTEETRDIRPPPSVQPDLGPAALEREATSNFVLVKLPRGVEVTVPKGWWLIGSDYNRLIETSVEAAMDISGVGLKSGNGRNLIAANSLPRSTYAAVRVDSTIPPAIAQSEFSSITPSDIRELRNEMHRNLQKILPLQGNQLIELQEVRIEKISGYPAVITEYRRTGPKGPVFVQLNQIYTPAQEIRINLSYRESEVALWKAVVAKIRQSIVVRSWP